MKIGILACSLDVGIAASLLEFLSHENGRDLAILEWGQSGVSDAEVRDLEFLIIVWSRHSPRTENLAILPESIYKLEKAKRTYWISVDGSVAPFIFGEHQIPRLSATGGAAARDAVYQAVNDILLRVAGGSHAKLPTCSSITPPRPAAAARQVSMPERRRYDFRELFEFSRIASNSVSEFKPDVFFSFDARGAIWAQIIAERLHLPVPIIVGFRLKPTGPRKPSCKSCVDRCHLIQTYADSHGGNESQKPRWHLLVPPALIEMPNTKKVVFVDDYTNSGDTCWALKRFLIEERGFSEENVRTLSLVTAKKAVDANRQPDICPHVTQAARADLFYMFRR